MNYMKHCDLLRQSCPEPMKCGNGCQCVKKDGSDMPAMDDGGFFDTVDQIVTAARWILLAFVVGILSVSCVGYFFGG